MNDVLPQAQRLVASGLSVIPVRADGSKAAAVTWKPYQHRRASSEELAGWFKNDAFGIGIIGGAVSGNLEILDIEEKDVAKEFGELVKQNGGSGLLEKLPLVKTPGGGCHLFYRSEQPVGGNHVLARGMGPEGRTEVKIETRATGGYVVAPGSPPTCHPLNLPYKQWRGDLARISTITIEERELLLSNSRALSEFIDPERIVAGPEPGRGDRPGDDFNIRASWEDILTPHEWKVVSRRDKTSHWRRPGKRTGISATTNHGDSDLFYCFTSNGDPFEADRAYTKFAAYTLLNYSGDFPAAAADLLHKGYGGRPPDGPSYASFAYQGQGKKGTSFASYASFAEQDEASWPNSLTVEAFHGLAGEIVRVHEPHTEADSAALLLQLLVAFGNCIGSSPHFMVEGARHSLNEFVAIVGKTAKGRKGTSWGRVRSILRSVDPGWVEDRIQSGLSSGEGLIWSVRDPIQKTVPIYEKKRVVDYQTVIEDQGVDDKRLLVEETEFAAALKVLKRQGNTLSPVLRRAWDTGSLNILNKNSPAKATGAHISVIGHISKDELLRHLDQTETANGFGNRFLFGCAQRSKSLPDGGDLSAVDLGPIINRFRKAIDFSRMVQEINRDDQAREIWHGVYPALSEGKPGLFGAMIARAEAHVMRLACMYALLDKSDHVSGEHLLAALAVWEYCEASCRHLFGDKLGDPVAD